MIRVLQEIFERTLARLSQQLVNYVPPLIVAAVILLSALVLATLLRWMILKAIKATALDSFLRTSGLAPAMEPSAHSRAAVILAGAAYWITIGAGFLTALDVFDTSLTTRMIEVTVFAVPRLFTAALILLAGLWLSRYLGRGALVWSVNEGVPFARRWAAAVKAAILFVAVVVAAETLGFAERVFFTAFVVFVAAVALAGSIAFGLTLRSMMERSLRDPGKEREEERERSLWSHL